MIGDLTSMPISRKLEGNARPFVNHLSEGVTGTVRGWLQQKPYGPPWTVARLCVMDVQLQLTRRKTRRSILEINHAPLQCMFRSDGCAVPDQLDGFDCSSFIFSRPPDHALICLQLSTPGEGPQSGSASMGPPSQKGTDLQGGAGGAVESRQLQ